MREMGLEPTRAYTHKILSLACLPIPALPQKPKRQHNKSLSNRMIYCALIVYGQILYLSRDVFHESRPEFF
jgi:hypothetical protein